MSTCRTCRTPIIWATLPSGRRIPVDTHPHAKGNIRLADTPHGTPHAAQVLTGTDLETARAAGEHLHQSHFATCPNADTHRRRSQ